jgi:hypothetical protein
MMRNRAAMALMLCVIVSLCFAGCVATSKTFLTPNADLIDQSIVKSIESLGDIGIPEGKTVAVSELVSKKSDNNIPSALISDELVRGLRSKGYNVVDRDRDAIRLLAPEVTEGGFVFQARSLDLGIDNAAAWDAQVGYSPEYQIAKTEQGNILILKKADGDSSRTMAHLPNCDYLFLYRVLETGIRYGKIDTTKSGMITRRARIAFTYRVVHVESATVMMAGRIDHFIDDQIPQTSKTMLGKNLYVYYPHGHPDFTVNTGRESQKEETEVLSSSSLFEAKGEVEKGNNYYGFGLGYRQFSEKDTKDMVPTGYEITYEMMHGIGSNVFLSSAVGFGNGVGETDSIGDAGAIEGNAGVIERDAGAIDYDDNMEVRLQYIPARISGVYGFDMGGIMPYLGGGLFFDYTFWAVEGFEKLRGEASLFGLQLHAGMKASVFQLNLRYLMASSAKINGDFKDGYESEVSTDGMLFTLACLF